MPGGGGKYRENGEEKKLSSTVKNGFIELYS